MISNILGMFASGYSLERISMNYPSIQAEDISAALRYTGQKVRVRRAGVQGGG